MDEKEEQEKGERRKDAGEAAETQGVQVDKEVDTVGHMKVVDAAVNNWETIGDAAVDDVDAAVNNWETVGDAEVDALDPHVIDTETKIRISDFSLFLLPFISSLCFTRFSSLPSVLFSSILLILFLSHHPPLFTEHFPLFLRLISFSCSFFQHSLVNSLFVFNVFSIFRFTSFNYSSA